MSASKGQEREKAAPSPLQEVARESKVGSVEIDGRPKPVLSKWEQTSTSDVSVKEKKVVSKLGRKWPPEPEKEEPPPEKVKEEPKPPPTPEPDERVNMFGKLKRTNYTKVHYQ